jgi:hypothetical protein
VTASMVAATMNRRSMTSACHVHGCSPAHVPSAVVRVFLLGFPVMACRASKYGWARMLGSGTGVPGVSIDTEWTHQ